MNALQGRFLKAYETYIRAGLEGVLRDPVEILPLSVSDVVRRRFLTSLAQRSTSSVFPAFHGTPLQNHERICEEGLLIPGQGNDLQVVNGAAHGRGIYTANVNAAWLSRGFCSSPSIIVCAVLQSPSLRHVMDAMVVFNAAHVIPLFTCTSRGFGQGGPRDLPSLRQAFLGGSSRTPSSLPKAIKASALLQRKRSSGSEASVEADNS